MENNRFCRYCGNRLPAQAVVCNHCGRQIRRLRQEQPNIIINNTNTNINSHRFSHRKMKNKWVAFLLCLFLGYLGAHKFYEGKTGMGILYIFTFGLCGIGWLIDIISLLLKPNPYYI